ncbi:ubinuclein-1-like isoform X2 [Wolffia australiana]
MDEEKGGGSVSGRVASTFTSSPAPPANSPSPSRRRRFTVELKSGETTIVSWKRLVRESKINGDLAAPSGAHPALESRIAPPAAVRPVEGEQKDAQAGTNRFSAVIEKIERLYMGKESSDEEDVNDIPDDDQYDTEDSFIDDSELNEYFEVEKQKTKHDGFFVNRGALETLEPSSSVPNVLPKKRRRKESMKDDTSQEMLNAGSIRLKAAARSAPLVGPTKMISPFVDIGHERKVIKNKLTSSKRLFKKKHFDPTMRVDSLTFAKLPSRNVLSSSLDNQEVTNHQSGSMRTISKPISTTNLTSTREKGGYQLLEPHTKLDKDSETLVRQKIRRTEKNGSEMLPDLNSPRDLFSLQRVKSPIVNDGAVVIRPKGTTLERAIRDLEKIVSACRPTCMDMQDLDPALQVKKRLPQEIKQKIAKVARLAASQGKVKEDDLLDRLMSIVGHLVQRKTLKRNLKEMVERGLSAKQEKSDRFQQIKKEVTEMIKARVTHSKAKIPEQQDSFSDDFQESIGDEERKAPKPRSSMDDAIEDRICDLYELYVEGMDEDKGPQMRKLYVELAELWPNGYMDNVGIKDAIYRAKERRKTLHRQQFRAEERTKRKKLAVSTATATAAFNLDPAAQQLLADPTEQPLLLTGKALALPLVNGSQTLPQNGNPLAAKPDAAALFKKKLKRKLAQEAADKVNASGPSLAP